MFKSQGSYIRKSIVLYCGAHPPKKNPGSAPASLCISTESINKAITVATRGLFGAKKKGKKKEKMEPIRIPAQF